MTVFKYIEYDYNRWLHQSAFRGLSLEQFENQSLA